MEIPNLGRFTYVMLTSDKQFKSNEDVIKCLTSQTQP